MKSYLRFLGRNKLYTAIEVLGLSIALAFVILLSSYIVDDLNCDKDIKDKDRICLAHIFEVPMIYDQFIEIASELPDVEYVSWYTQSRSKTMFNSLMEATGDAGRQHVDVAAISDDFFKVMTLPLTGGDPDNVFQQANGAVISERLAKQLYPDGDALGGKLRLSDYSILDINLVITGIYKDLDKTIFKDNDVLFSHTFYSSLPIYSNTEQASICFLKLRPGTSHADVGAAFTDEVKNRFRPMFGDAINDFMVHVVPFNEIRNQNYETYSFVFNNIRKSNMLSTYIIMCIFIVLIALLDYIVLTLAFSRFRLKEIATRRLLGTERNKVMLRCVMESLFLLVVSSVFAILIAFALRTQIGMILGTELKLFTQTDEYIIIFGIIAVMAVIASSAPSIVISSYKPIDVLKGETRHHDKMTFSKVFIGISGALSIIGVAVCLGITLQTRYMISQPLGYETDNIIYARFNTYNIDRDARINKYIDELKSEGYVQDIGMIEGPPMYVHGTWTRHCRSTDGASNWLYTIAGNHNAFDILGIERTADFGNHSEMDIYLCEGSYASNPAFVPDDMLEFLDGKTPVCGLCSDYRSGSLKDFDVMQRLIGIQIYNTDSWNAELQPLIKVNIDEDLACRQIRKFYAEKGYDETVVTVTTLNDMLVEPFREERNTQKLMLIFALISILMSSMTVVGLSSYYAKTSEVDTAVKKVFGSSEWEIFRDTLLGFSVPVLVSAVVAIPLSWIYLDRWLENYAYRIGNSPLIYAVALLVVLTVVVISLTLQTIRLVRTNPAEALKKE